MPQRKSKHSNTRSRYKSNSSRMGNQFIERAMNQTIIDREASKGKKRQHVESPDALSKFFDTKHFNKYEDDLKILHVDGR